MNKVLLLIFIISSAYCENTSGFSSAGATSNVGSLIGNGGFSYNSTQNTNVSNNNATVLNSGNSLENAFNSKNQITNVDVGNSEGDFNKKGYNNSYGKKISSSVIDDNDIVDEFQKNVVIRTGLHLPRFGYNFFKKPDTFTPIDNVQVSDNYIIGAGDKIFIQAWGATEISYTAEVHRDGSIFIPKVGQILIAGIKYQDLELYLKEKIGKIYRNFTISATITKIKAIQINVTGFANNPGTYVLSSLSTLINVVFASGGPNLNGSLRNIQLKRNNKIIANFDMYDLLLKGDNSKDVHLLSGDIIYYAPKEIEVAIYNGVKAPAIYEIRNNEKVKDIIEFAGGLSFNNNQQTVIIENFNNNKVISINNYSFNLGINEKLTNGAIVHFNLGNNSYDNSVVLIGNIANPSRFKWFKGIKISNIIKNKEFLLTKSFWNSYNYNTYGKDQLLELSNREKTTYQGLTLSSNDFASGFNEANSFANSLFSIEDNLFKAGPLSIPEADINWHYGVIVRIDPMTYSSNIIPFDLMLALEHDSKNDIELQPNDIINVLSVKDMRNPTKLSSLYIFIDGEVKRPGVYQLSPHASVLDVINIAGGTTEQAYLYGLELTRDSIKQRQQKALMQMINQLEQNLLGQATASSSNIVNSNQLNIQNQLIEEQKKFIDKLKKIKPSGRIILGLKDANVKLDNLSDIFLENGDNVYIPPIPSTIDVIGQVYNPATFIYNSKNTLGDYINMAGTTNKLADNSSIYVLHADGSLYSKQQAGLFSPFYSLTLNPGDAIIIPQDISLTNVTQTLINWTQILANFGLGVAAIKQLGD